MPVAVRGVFELWPRNRAFDWRRLLPWKRQRIHIAFGRPMRFPAEVGYAEASAELRDRVGQLWNDLPASPEHRNEKRHTRD